MTRNEFLQELRIALQGKVSQGQVNEHLRYYENYIMEESRKGTSEDEVIAALGNPRLIAKTIIETSNESGYKEEDSAREQEENTKRRRGFHISLNENNGWDIHYGKLKLNSWYGYLLLAIILIFLLVLLANIAMVLLPIIIPVILVAILLYLIFFSNRK